MELKFKKLHADAKIPTRAHAKDAGLDLTAVSMEYNREYDFYEYDTALAVEIPSGYVGFLAPRSSISKTGMHMCNSMGTIDCGYLGPIKARFYKPTIAGFRSESYKVGDKIAQLILVPIALPTPVETGNLNDTARGQGGFGSTGT